MREVETREDRIWDEEAAREAAMERAGRARTKKRRRIKKQFWAIFALFVVGVIAALILTVLFPVRSISVTGESRYELDAVQSAVGVDIGSNIILTDSAAAALRVQEQLPYIGTVSISKKLLSGTLDVTVHELPVVYAYMSGGKYDLVNENGKIVEITDTQPDGSCLVIGAEPSAPQAGYSYQFENEDTAALFNQLTASLAADGLSATRIDLSDSSNLCFVIDNRIYVKLGSVTNMDYKIAHAAAAFTDMAATDEGTLDLTWWSESKKDAYFRRGNIEDIINGTDVTTTAVQGVQVGTDASDSSESSSAVSSSNSGKTSSKASSSVSSKAASSSSKKSTSSSKTASK